MMNISRRTKINILLGTIVAALIGTMLAPPIPQDLAYHQFADQREIWGIPNFWNVITNAPFFIIGLVGVGVVLRRDSGGVMPQLRTIYLTFFFGMAAVALGSGYYHLSPSNETLVWDRLPMTVSFMAFCSVIAGERLSIDLGNRLFWPLVFFGVLSVMYWDYTESLGRGDLRPYALVQFLPGLLIPMTLLMFESRFSDNRYFWAMLVFYVLAKIAEALDDQIFALLGQLSGHSIKHLIASFGGVVFCLALRNRVPVQNPLSADNTRFENRNE